MTVWCCVASGPSVTAEDVDKLKGRARVLVVNDNYRLAPWADAVYAADLKWWHIHHTAIAPDFEGRMYSIETGDAKNPRLGNQIFGLRVFKQDVIPGNKRLDGLSKRPGYLRLGGLSGYQAINAAYQWGATVILLLGYDCQGTHWFGDHPKGLTNRKYDGKEEEHFATIKPADYGIEIINCSRETLITCFPRMTIDAALEKYASSSAPATRSVPSSATCTASMA